jgi:hypothetical protein
MAGIAKIVGRCWRGGDCLQRDSHVAQLLFPAWMIAVGDGNQFGHPVGSVIARFAAAGVRFLRTDRDGEVTSLTDGKTLTVQTFADQYPH